MYAGTKNGRFLAVLLGALATFAAIWAQSPHRAGTIMLRSRAVSDGGPTTP